MTARMRTITEAIKAIREADPQTAFTETALRRMIKRGEIPSVKSGCKNLVNLDVLFDYLNNSAVPISAVNPANTKNFKIREKIFT
jgi:fatty acid-binding protein DegV